MATKLSLIDYSYIPVTYPDMQFLPSSDFYSRVQHDIPSNSTRLSDDDKIKVLTHIEVRYFVISLVSVTRYGLCSEKLTL
jgi:hypothetical protein